MKNIWSLICSKAIIDSNSNSLSLFDCIEEVVVGFPNMEEMNKPIKNIPLIFSIVSLWVNDDTIERQEFNQIIEFFDSENKKIKEFSNIPIFEKDKKRLRTITQINGIGLTKEGKYMIIVKYKKINDKNYITASEIPLDIKFVLNTPFKIK